MESEEVNKTDASNIVNTIPISTTTTTTTTTTNNTHDDLTNGHGEQDQAQQSQAQSQYEEFNRDFVEHSNEESKEEHESSHVEQQQAEQLTVDESNQNHEATNQQMNTSASTEFTYTSLAGVSRPDDEVDLVESPNQPQELFRTTTTQNEHQLDIHLNQQLDLNDKKPIVRESSVNSVDLQSVSIQDDSLKRFTIDEVIDKVKLNSVSNKDVCNYILNLLVDGEFDLEKNFVIKNINSILHMIQVIKCAQPSLKVRPFFFCFLIPTNSY